MNGSLGNLKTQKDYFPELSSPPEDARPACASATGRNATPQLDRNIVQPNLIRPRTHAAMEETKQKWFVEADSQTKYVKLALIWWRGVWFGMMGCPGGLQGGELVRDGLYGLPSDITQGSSLQSENLIMKGTNGVYRRSPFRRTRTLRLITQLSPISRAQRSCIKLRNQTSRD